MFDHSKNAFTCSGSLQIRHQVFEILEDSQRVVKMLTHRKSDSVVFATGCLMYFDHSLILIRSDFL